MAGQRLSYLLLPGTGPFLSRQVIKQRTHHLNNIGSGHQCRYGAYQIASVSERVDSKAEGSQKLIAGFHAFFLSGAKLYSYRLE